MLLHAYSEGIVYMKEKLVYNLLRKFVITKLTQKLLL